MLNILMFLIVLLSYKGMLTVVLQGEKCDSLSLNFREFIICHTRRRRTTNVSK